MKRGHDMHKSDERILSYLRVYKSEYPDRYFINCSKWQKEKWLYFRLEKVKEWAIKNGGRFDEISEKKIIGDRKGIVVRIIFPCYGKRDMKNIMATLY